MKQRNATMHIAAMLFVVIPLFASSAAGTDSVDDSCRAVLATFYCDAIEHVDDGCEGVFAVRFCGELGNLTTLPDPTNGTVSSGTIVDWPESGAAFRFDDHTSVSSGIDGWWSINRLNPPRGWFYGYNEDTQVAHVTGVTEVCQIMLASTYEYDDSYVGPVEEGEFVVLRNTATGYYAAFRVDDIDGPDPLSAEADVTWYLQEDGSDSFGPCLP